MAETNLDVRALPKPEAYAQLRAQLAAVLDGIDDEVTAMATISCVVHHGFSHLWTGFYRAVAPTRLRVGHGNRGRMKLATLRAGGRDGTLVVVRRDGSAYAAATDIAPTLQAALDDWDRAEPALRALAARLERGEVPAQPLDPRALHAP